MKKVTLTLLAVIISIFCYAQTPWTTTFDYYDLGLDSLFAESLSPILQPQNIFTTSDGIIIVTSGRVLHGEYGDHYYWFTYVFKTDFDGTILWISCDEVTGGLTPDPYDTQITGGQLYNSVILSNGSVVTNQRDGLFLRDGATGEITASISDSIETYWPLLAIPETNELCIQQGRTNPLAFRFYNENDLSFNYERIVETGLENEQIQTFYLIAQKAGNLYFTVSTFQQEYLRYLYDTYILDTNDNISQVLDTLAVSITLQEDGSFYGLASEDLPSTRDRLYSVIHCSPSGDLLHSVPINDDYIRPYKIFVSNDRIFYLKQGHGEDRIIFSYNSDLSQSSFYQFEEIEQIAFCTNNTGFYAANTFNLNDECGQDITDMKLYNIDLAQMPIEKDEIPLPLQMLTCYPNPFNPETTIEFMLTEPYQTQLSVFNIKGQLVKTLVNQRLQSGVHKI
ncbi:MAG: hypothetical protein K8S56_01225, partial [Candidatus Cloacimonetes bacterium]|nr:hypothetical protein [Candidatus Cloacimonadota bacterium]